MPLTKRTDDPLIFYDRRHHTNTSGNLCAYLGHHQSNEPVEIPHQVIDHWEILFIEKGTCDCQINDANVIISGGQGYIIPSGSTISSNGQRSRGTMFWGGFFPEAEGFPPALNEEWEHWLHRGQHSHFMLSKRTLGNIHDLWQAANRLTHREQNKQPTSQWIWFAATCSLISSLLSTQDTSHSSTTKIEPALELIGQNIAEEYDITVLAAACGLSEGAFRQYFRQSMGESPHNWITIQRLQQAQVLIRKSASYSLEQVAHRIGLSGRRQLVRLCKRFFDCHPDDWSRTDP